MDDGQIIRFEHAGDMLYAFAEGAAYRVAKNGPQLMISKMQGGRSIVNRKACATLGRDIIGVTPLGVTIFDGESGSMNTVGALDRLIMEDWIDEWDDIFVVNDNILGCSYIVSPDDEQAALVWHVTGAITLLDDCRWAAGCSGPDPTTGGRSRAFFVTAAGLVTTVDEDRSETFTMHGLDTSYTLNGTASAGGDTTHLIDSGATFHADMVGTKVYIFDSDGTYNSTVISAVDVGNDKLTLTDAQAAAPDAKRYCIDPVPFRVRLWGIHPAGSPLAFGRRTSTGVGVFSAGHVGMTSNDNAFWRVGLCKNYEAAPTNELQVVAMDENPADQWVYSNVQGAALEPWVEQISSETDYRLLAVGVDVTIDTGRKME